MLIFWGFIIKRICKWDNEGEICKVKGSLEKCEISKLREEGIFRRKKCLFLFSVRDKVFKIIIVIKVGLLNMVVWKIWVILIRIVFVEGWGLKFK